MFKRWRRNRQLGKIKPGNGSALPKFRWYQLFGRSIFFIELQEHDGAHTYAIDVRYFDDELSGQKGDSTWDGSTRETDEDDNDGKSISEVVSGWFSEDGSGSEWSDWLGGNLFGGKERRDQADRPGDIPDGEATLLQSGPPAVPNERKPGKAPAALYRDGVQLYRSKLPATFPVPGGVIEVAASGYGASRMHFVGDDHGRAYPLVPHRRTAEGLRARFGKRFPAMSKAVGALAIIILVVGLVVGIPQGIEMLTSIEPIAERVGTFSSPIQLPVWANISLFVAGALAATERALTIRNHWLIDFDTTWTAFG